MSKSKMNIWDAVSKTNPKYTKKVKFGREFTAIDPHSQIMEATKAFGPAGEGWGWTVERVEWLPTNDVAILIRVWHTSREQYFEQWGQAGLYIDKGNTKKDADCMKKATTDGLTKCLSYLGFNADIFLGKFDDNKYVQEVSKEFKAKEAAESWTEEHEALFNQAIVTMEQSKTLDELSAARTNLLGDYRQIQAVSAEKAQAFGDIYKQCEKRLKG